LKKKKSKKMSLIKYKPTSFINTHALFKREFGLVLRVLNLKTEQLELARDMFVMQVWLGGLRQVDFYKLSKQNFNRDSNGVKIWFKQQKTDDVVQNTINQNYLDPIMEKYPQYFLKNFRKFIFTNKLLKKAAEVAGLKRPLMFTFEYVDAQ